MIQIDDTLYQKLKTIISDDKRYSMHAYIFILQSLDYTIEHMTKEKRHITGKELLEGTRQFAISQFGELTKMTFNLWGLHTTEDIGNIVFNMVKIGLMGKTDQDSIEDFKNVFDFRDAFNNI